MLSSIKFPLLGSTCLSLYCTHIVLNLCPTISFIVLELLQAMRNFIYFNFILMLSILPLLGKLIQFAFIAVAQLFYFLTIISVSKGTLLKYGIL